LLTNNENNFIKKVKEALKSGSDLYEKERKIAEITFTSITPWWGGDAERYTRDLPTPDTIVGKTRWFLRTVYNTFCASNLDSYEESFEFINNFLGSNSKASLFTIEVSQTEKKSTMKSDKKGKSPTFIKDNFIVKIYQTFAYSENDDMAKFKDIFIGGLLITLAYVGIGKGANRGYGRFYPVEIAYDGGSKESPVKKIAEKIQGGSIREAFGAYYVLFKNNLKDKCNKDKGNDWRNSSVPLAPPIQPAGEKSRINLEVIKLDDKLERSILESNVYETVAKNTVDFIKCIASKKTLGKSGLNKQEIDCLEGKLKEKTAERGRVSFLNITPVSKIDKDAKKLYGIAFIPFLSFRDYHGRCSEQNFEKIFNTLTNVAFKHCLYVFKKGTEGYERKPFYENRGWKGRERRW